MFLVAPHLLLHLLDEIRDHFGIVLPLPHYFVKQFFFNNDCKADVIMYLWLCSRKTKPTKQTPPKNPHKQKTPKTPQPKTKQKPKTKSPQKTQTKPPLWMCCNLWGGGRNQLLCRIWHHESFLLKLHEMWICTFLCCVNASSALFSSGFSVAFWGLNNFFYFFLALLL